MLDGSVERPGNHGQGTGIEFPQEVGVFVVLQPGQEETRGTVAVHVVSALRPVFRQEAAVGDAHGIGHAFDEAPVHPVIIIAANPLRGKLIHVRELMEQDAARLEQHFIHVISGVGVLDMLGTVEHIGIRAFTVLGGNSVHIFQRVVDILYRRDAVGRRKVQRGQHIPGLLRNIGFGVLDDLGINLRAFRLFGLVLKDDLAHIVSLPVYGFFGLPAGCGHRRQQNNQVFLHIHYLSVAAEVHP